MKVLVFGNPLVEDDSLPLRLIPALQEEFPAVEFDEADPADIDAEEGQVVVIDAAKGIGKDVVLIDDTEKLQHDKIMSAHGLGLAEMLALMKAAGRQIQVKIICVPQGMKQSSALAAVTKMLRAIVP